MRVLVTSAHGNQGRQLVPQLVARGILVRALDITPAAEAPLKAAGAAEVIIGDASDPHVLAAACAGVDAVYHIGPNAHPRETAMGKAVIDAARTAKVRHFIYSSVLHPEITALAQHTAKRDVEEYLFESGLDHSILQPAHYMQTLQYHPAMISGKFLLTWSLDRRQVLIDVADIAAVAAKVIAEGAPHFGATYQLCGTDCLTAHEIASIIADVSGVPVTAEEVTPAEVIVKVFPGAERDPSFPDKVALFTDVSRWYSAHDFTGNANVLTLLLGRPPTTFANFLRRELAAA